MTNKNEPISTHEIKDGQITTTTVFSIDGKEQTFKSSSPIKEKPRKPLVLKINPNALKRFSVKLKHLRVHQETVAAARLAHEHEQD